MATIRGLSSADFPAVVAMAEDAAARALVGRPLWETAADVAAELGAPGRRAFVVAEEDTGAVVGMAGYRLLPGGEAEVYGPLVTTEGHGIGAWLEARVTAMAAADGASEFSMLIGLQNRSGAAWAEWRGYMRDLEEPELLLTWLYPGELRPGSDVLSGVAAVRPAAAADLPRIEALVEECFPLRRAEPGAWLGEAWVVESDGEVAGCLRLEPVTAWIDYLCIDPAVRRRGLGARLLTGVAEQVWQEQPRKLGLAVPLDDAAPVSLFRRLGFRREMAVARWMKR